MKINNVMAVFLCTTFAACGGGTPAVTNITVVVNNYGPDAGLAPSTDGGTVMMTDAGVADNVAPVIMYFSIFDAFTTGTTAGFAYKVSEDGIINFRLDGPGWSRSSDFEVAKEDLYFADFTNLQCDTPYKVVTWATDRAGNHSSKLPATFRTKACAGGAQPELIVTVITGPDGAPDREQNVKIDTANVPVFAFKVTAKGDSIRLPKLKLTAEFQHEKDIKNLQLFLDGQSAPIATAPNMIAAGQVAGQKVWTCTWTAADNLLTSLIQDGSTFVFHVRADVGSPGAAGLGDTISFRIAWVGDIEGKGTTSGAPAVVKLINPAVFHNLHIVPFSVFLSAVSPTNDYMSEVGPGSLLAKVGVYNNGNPKVSITKVLFTDKGSHTGSTTTLEMYYSQQNPGASSPLWFAGPVGCNPSVDFVSSAGAIPLDGSSFRFLTVNMCSVGGAVAGDTWQFAIASHGHVRFAVAESDLGYDGNLDGQINGFINDLPTDGLPSLGKITKKP